MRLSRERFLCLESRAQKQDIEIVNIPRLGMIMSRTDDTTHSGIACDLKGVITSYGLGAQQLFGWTADEVVGKQSVVIFHEPQAVQTLVPRLLKTAAETGKFEEEVTLVRKDGRRFRGLLTVRPLKKENEITGYMGITKHIRDL